MPFTALKLIPNKWPGNQQVLVVRRLMPFTALKLRHYIVLLKYIYSCAPPNAVYGIETSTGCVFPIRASSVVRRLMPFTALKRDKFLRESSFSKVVRRLMPFTASKNNTFICKKYAIAVISVAYFLLPRIRHLMHQPNLTWILTYQSICFLL